MSFVDDYTIRHQSTQVSNLVRLGIAEEGENVKEGA
jgi:hypothetical protein